MRSLFSARPCTRKWGEIPHAPSSHMPSRGLMANKEIEIPFFPVPADTASIELEIGWDKRTEGTPKSAVRGHRTQGAPDLSRLFHADWLRLCQSRISNKGLMVMDV